MDLKLCGTWLDRKSTRLNSSHGYISYAVFCLKKEITGRTRGKWAGSVRGRESPWTAAGAALRVFGPARPVRPPLARRIPRRLHRCFLMIRRPPRSPPFPYTTLFRSRGVNGGRKVEVDAGLGTITGIDLPGERK